MSIRIRLVMLFHIYNDYYYNYNYYDNNNNNNNNRYYNYDGFRLFCPSGSFSRLNSLPSLFYEFLSVFFSQAMSVIQHRVWIINHEHWAFIIYLNKLFNRFAFARLGNICQLLSRVYRVVPTVWDVYFNANKEISLRSLSIFSSLKSVKLSRNFIKLFT